MFPHEATPAAELAAIECIQERIDNVAEDLASRELRYREIDAWQLAALLGVDLDDNGDWPRTFWACRPDPEEAPRYPLAADARALQSRITKASYPKLATMLRGEQSADWRAAPITGRRTNTPGDTYAAQLADAADLVIARASLSSSDGEELQFEIGFDPAGEPSDVFSPYDLADGNGFDASDYVEIE